MNRFRECPVQFCVLDASIFCKLVPQASYSDPKPSQLVDTTSICAPYIWGRDQRHIFLLYAHVCVGFYMSGLSTQDVCVAGVERNKTRWFASEAMNNNRQMSHKH